MVSQVYGLTWTLKKRVFRASCCDFLVYFLKKVGCGAYGFRWLGLCFRLMILGVPRFIGSQGFRILVHARSLGFSLLRGLSLRAPVFREVPWTLTSGCSLGSSEQYPFALFFLGSLMQTEL